MRRYLHLLAALTAGELLDSLMTATTANPVGVWSALYTVAITRSALQLRDRVQAVIYAYETGVVSPS